MGSEDYGASNVPGDENSSLAARRAKLRGSFSKQAAPPEQYTPDPYLRVGANQTTATGTTAPSTTAPNTVAPGNGDMSSPLDSSLSPVATPNTNGASPKQTTAAQPASVGSSQEAVNSAPSPIDSLGGRAPVISAVFDQTTNYQATTTLNDVPPLNTNSSPQSSGLPPANPALSPAPNFSNATVAAAPENPSTKTLDLERDVKMFAEMTAEAPVEKGKNGALPPSAMANDLTHNQSNVNQSSGANGGLASQPAYSAVLPSSAENPYRQDSSVQESEVPRPVAAFQPPVSAPTPSPVNPPVLTASGIMQDRGTSAINVSARELAQPADSDQGPALQHSPAVIAPQAMQAPIHVQQMPLPIQTQAFEVLNNIDQAMGACAMNLSELQKIAGEQTEALRGLAQTLQNQSFFEIGLNLNTLMETLSAALEPMKAVGELVPAIDQLVSVMEARESTTAQTPQKLSPDQLVTNLADQLSSGVIDPWTFKCAYIAIFPADHPADLLHRLVDLLGTQRLSGELFRAAYDAVQAAEPTKTKGSVDEEARTVVKVVQDESLLAQIQLLQETNEEFRLKQNEVERLFSQKEKEFTAHIVAKERELQEAQELLNSRYEEFNARYDQLTETLHKRDEALQEKEAEISRKESENVQLRTQMEELREQTKEMLADLQRMSNQPKDVASMQGGQPQLGAAQQKAAGFFDAVPNQQNQNLFDPNRPQLPQQQQPMQPMQPMQQMQQMQQPDQQNQAPTAPMSQQAPAQPLTNQAVPKPPAPTTPFAGAAGSYGSGVRAQVFEVIVRQALAGAPWREICAGPMQVNNITPDEVENEVKRRQAMLKK